MLEFIKQIAEENSIKVSEEVIKQVALIASSPSHQGFFFDSLEEGLSPWAVPITNLINTCKYYQNSNLYLTSTGAYPVNSVTSAIDAATDKVRQDGGKIQVFKVEDTRLKLYATISSQGTKYENTYYCIYSICNLDNIGHLFSSTLEATQEEIGDYYNYHSFNLKYCLKDTLKVHMFVPMRMTLGDAERFVTEVGRDKIAPYNRDHCKFASLVLQAEEKRFPTTRSLNPLYFLPVEESIWICRENGIIWALSKRGLTDLAVKFDLPICWSGGVL